MPMQSEIFDYTLSLKVLIDLAFKTQFRTLLTLLTEQPISFLARRPRVCQGLLIHEVSKHTQNDAPQSVGLLWTSDQLVAETSTWQQQQQQQHSQQTSMPPAGFEPTTSAGERP